MYKKAGKIKNHVGSKLMFGGHENKTENTCPQYKHSRTGCNHFLIYLLSFAAFNNLSLM
jgi:hypothetical protein